ncbi:uncharacterized protein LOC119562305 [Drosophila subpulchrella]|uniref:uncharacterized protein LOC119562305 n=1 Tax=Drosophila subpulchrella TaxID=1486046 RepID=UPI0018A16BD0|nr:uncharacterized protein LOC119562305 [Drosophila subpulchrella]
MSEIPSDITEMRARLSEQRREWAAKGEPYPTEEWARQQAEALQDEAEQQYWEELPLIDALRTTAFQLRRVLSNHPVNEDRLLALVDRQEQNMLNYEAWMATHDRMKEETEWVWEPSDEEQQRTTEKEARWHARLQEVEEEERRLWEEPVQDSWEVPLTPSYAAEEPSPGRKSEDGDEPCAPSPPRWLPEVPPTPRYEGEWFANEVRDSDGGAPLATPPWRPARPPTPPPGTGREAESLEKGPWVWLEPPATQRPPLQRPSTPGATRPRPQFTRQVLAPEEGGWREIARSEWPEGIEEAPAVATARRKGGRRCVLVTEGGPRYRQMRSPLRTRSRKLPIWSQMQPTEDE